MKEFPLNNVPCVVCGQLALAFVPAAGVKHRSGWCRVGFAEWPPVLTPARRLSARPALVRQRAA